MTEIQTEAPAQQSAPSPRLAQFEEEVAGLKVTGGGANKERLGAQWGIGLTILGFVVSIIAWWSALDSSEGSTQVRALIFAVIGIGISLVGIIVWARNSMTRYLRYWIIRLVYEQREQTDSIARLMKDR
ncbi:MAG TPA: hypothetical protein VFR41_03290 [Acidimicrobiia bacterium]|nr:hypothetical protein [Acidimicrobiia bacterium]